MTTVSNSPRASPCKIVLTPSAAPNVPQACFESVHAFVISCFGNEGPRFPDNLLDEPAVSDLVETMTSWFGWNEIERKENVLSLKKLIDRSFTRFGQPQPGKKTAFVLFYGGLGEETVTGKLK